jgi:hypothetical protein
MHIISEKNPHMRKTPNQNPHLLTSFDSTDLFTSIGDLKKNGFGDHIWGKG